MLSVQELEFCRQFAATSQTPTDARKVYLKVFERDEPSDAHALAKRDDIQFEVACRTAELKHKARVMVDAQAALILDLSVAELRARQEAMLAIIGETQLIIKRQASGVKISPGEARFLETAAKATGLVGGDTVNINMPVVTTADAEALEARRKAALDKLTQMTTGRA